MVFMLRDITINVMLCIFLLLKGLFLAYVFTYAFYLRSYSDFYMRRVAIYNVVVA